MYSVTFEGNTQWSPPANEPGPEDLGTKVPLGTLIPAGEVSYNVVYPTNGKIAIRSMRLIFHGAVLK